MPLPEIIPVKYTEEEADYVSVRPLVRQNFRAAELVDMIVRVAGKDPARVLQILRSGTVVFQAYRYWWQAFEADAAALAGLMAAYPEADPSRPFRAESCTEVIMETGASAKRHGLAIRREQARKKPFWRRESFWDRLMAVAGDLGVEYREYSYALRGDVYAAALSDAQAADLARDAAKLAPRALRMRIAALPPVGQVAFFCPRAGSRER